MANYESETATLPTSKMLHTATNYVSDMDNDQHTDSNGIMNQQL